ncbi:MAG: response regulator [Nitrosopumilus sp.]|nr:response regulator [Nitrosopumilus sp.]MDH3824585.1 response regulator [Nitrosopumilus sp.]
MNIENNAVRVLLIDDNSEITELFATTLTAKGYTVQVTNHGKEGLDLIKKKESDLVLLDLAMPGFSGEDVLKELIKDGPIKDYNIYIFTASIISDQDIDNFIKLGVTGCLRKPVRLDDVLGVLEKHQT